MIKSIPLGSQPAFSFLYDGLPFNKIVNRFQMEHKVESSQTEGSIVYSDPQTGLKVVQQYRVIPEFFAVEWVLNLENTGSETTALIEDILPIDSVIPVQSAHPVTLHHAKGSLCKIDDFLPQASFLQPGQPLELKTLTGRSSETAFPFMNAAWPGGGCLLALGWTGSWKATFTREETGIRVRAGMAETRLKLYPGERIRTPRILLADWAGEDFQIGQNHMRRLILAHYTRKVDGDVALPPFAHMTMSTYHLTNKTDEETELTALAKAAGLGLEAFWVDACWYGSGRTWWEDVGNWQVRKSSFPNGLKPIGDAAHANGMKFILWFEPERVRHDTPIALEHPDFVLRIPQDSENLLLDLGNPDAWTYIVEAVSEQIRAAGVDIYRQDFNMPPGPFWKENDEPDRIGMKEIRHIEGLYSFWDELQRRFPHLLIDNCSSGGRRIDLEMTKRSFPLWRSDFSDIGSLDLGEGKLQIGDQSQTIGLSRWVPLHAASIWSFTPYAFRSAMSTGLCVYCSMTDEKFPIEQAKHAFGELKRIRNYMLGDFYELVPLTIHDNDWCVYQFHRTDLDEGIAVFLRRHKSPYESVGVSLRGLDPDAQYEYGSSVTFDEPTSYTRASGQDLQQFNISLDEAPGSLLLYYRKVGADQ
jgi:alpha-galactosidase